MAISTLPHSSLRGRLLALAVTSLVLTACTSVALPPYNPGGSAATRPATVPATPPPAPATGVIVQPIPQPAPLSGSILQPSMGLDSGETIIGDTNTAATPAPTPAPAPVPATPDRLCNEGAGQFAIGQPYSLSLLTQVRERTASRGVRVLRPGDMATMDFNAQRANLQLDADGKVETMRCG